ncbi:hypothetical protein ACQKIL_14180, partial [Staphylococcus aureus]
ITTSIMLGATKVGEVWAMLCISLLLVAYLMLYAPISGKVVEVNEELEDSPEFVNESPYEKAWMVKVEISDESQIEALLTAEKYSKMIGE